MNTLNGLLDDMEAYLEECKSIPFSSKAMVNMEIVYEFLSDFRVKLPEEVRRAAKLLDEEEKILADAREAARKMTKEAEVMVRQLIDENEIKKMAEEQARAIIEDAQQTAYEIQKGTYGYVDEVLANFQDVIAETLNSCNSRYRQFEEYAKNQIGVLEENRQQLQNKK
ncbi:ATP synthase F0 subunit B [Anaerotalea alkaliphila]|uniref:ATP synthase F0 subunit B n=1 Tax=Anaerotalea alkaliphila TaxID=2662126 RepID=A0A7X5HUE0_9FIRM|nr:ATP synthase F0 subunit B [Anaerotalea alkaliphila]NDL66876.1 ATP synthase F0 subunit B [Anaerotalea alkaliphila]